MTIERHRTGWTFLTNHAHVLLCISADQTTRIREIAAAVGITERAAQRIVSELEQAGYVSHQRVGRRNHYEIDSTQPMRHPLEEHIGVGALLQALGIRV